MIEWLFTFVVIGFAGADGAYVIEGGAFVLKPEYGEKECNEAAEMVRKKYEGKWVMTTCDRVKEGQTSERKRGDRS